ncbi:MAG TPA: hypothetical protein DCF63_16915 [Planctomycetaceae bacterium]|nr:hypothetical protein [Planctomycetaceae bacterium]
MNFKLDGKEYSDGAILPVGAKASIPIDLNINTAGTSGIRRYRIAIQYDDVKRRSFDLTKHLEFQVLGHLRVEPPSVTVLDAEINRQEQFQLYLSDGQLGEGIEIRDVVVSCQQRISTSIQTDDQSPTGDGRIRRKIVNVNYMPHDDYEYREDFVELVPANAAFSPVHVPIVCYKRPLGYLVTPKRLYLNEEELPARRTVECQSYSDRTASIDVISKPKFITVEIEAREKSKSILHVLVDRPESEKLESEVNEFEVVLGDSEEKTRTFCLPVYICSPIRK